MIVMIIAIMMIKIAMKNSVEHDANNKPGTSADIKAYIIDKQKLIKKRCKSLLGTKKNYQK